MWAASSASIPAQAAPVATVVDPAPVVAPVAAPVTTPAPAPYYNGVAAPPTPYYPPQPIHPSSYSHNVPQPPYQSSLPHPSRYSRGVSRSRSRRRSSSVISSEYVESIAPSHDFDRRSECDPEPRHRRRSLSRTIRDKFHRSTSKDQDLVYGRFYDSDDETRPRSIRDDRPRSIRGDPPVLYRSSSRRFYEDGLDRNGRRRSVAVYDDFDYATSDDFDYATSDSRSDYPYRPEFDYDHRDHGHEHNHRHHRHRRSHHKHDGIRWHSHSHHDSKSPGTFATLVSGMLGAGLTQKLTSEARSAFGSSDRGRGRSRSRSRHHHHHHHDDYDRTEKVKKDEPQHKYRKPLLAGMAAYAAVHEYEKGKVRRNQSEGPRSHHLFNNPLRG